MLTEDLLIELLSQKRLKNTDIEIIHALLGEIEDWEHLHKRLSKAQVGKLMDLIDKKSVGMKGGLQKNELI